jgi:hypothetical protein
LTKSLSVGDYNNRPTLVADVNFNGIAVIGKCHTYRTSNIKYQRLFSFHLDGDPYIPGAQNPDGSGVNWWTNQNACVLDTNSECNNLTFFLQNFFRSVRNFIIDTTAMPATSFGTGIHWQVGQATSLINIDFLLSAASGTKHQA